MKRPVDQFSRPLVLYCLDIRIFFNNSNVNHRFLLTVSSVIYFVPSKSLLTLSVRYPFLLAVIYQIVLSKALKYIHFLHNRPREKETSKTYFIIFRILKIPKCHPKKKDNAVLNVNHIFYFSIPVIFNNKSKVYYERNLNDTNHNY